MPPNTQAIDALQYEFATKAKALSRADLIQAGKKEYNKDKMNTLSVLAECVGKALTWSALVISGSLFAVPPALLCGAILLGAYQSFCSPWRKIVKI